METEHEGGGSTLVVIKAFAVNVAIAVAKAIVALIAGSAAMLAEAAHSFADTGNQVLLLVGMKKAKRDEDARHEFGYGSERYFWSFIVAVSLFTIGATFSIYEGVEKIVHRHGDEIGDPKWALIVLGVSICLELYSMKTAFAEFKHFQAGRSIRRAFDEARDAVVFVVLFEDAAALVGLSFALGGILLTYYTRDPLWDGVASILVGLTLGAVAGFLARKTKHLLIGEAVTAGERDRILELARTAPGVRKLIHLRTMHLGPDDVICAMKVAFDDDATTTQITKYTDEMEVRLRTVLPHLTRIYVEVGTVAEPIRAPKVAKADKPAEEKPAS
jgi:cation diffusion facilitator family transporter